MAGAPYGAPQQPPQGYPPQGYPPQGYPPQGYPPQGYPPGGYVMMQPQPHTSGMAIAGFVLSFFGCLSVLGLIFSLIGLSQIKKSNGMVKGGGFAIAGIVIACVWIVIYIIYFIALAKYGADHNSSDWD